MIPGHTKFICDSFFGQIKKIYRNQKVNTIDDVEKIINNSSKRNQAIQYNNSLGWTWYNFTSLFKNYFINFPHITQYYHFRFSNLSTDIEKVYALKESGGIEIAFQLLNDKTFDINIPLE